MSGESTPTYLHAGYPLKKKIHLTLGMLACWASAWYVSTSGASTPRTVLLIVVSAFMTLVWIMALYCRFSVDPEALHYRTLRGVRKFLRQDFETYETLSSDAGDTTATLLHFRTGIAFLSPEKGCDRPNDILEFLEQRWNIAAKDTNLRPTGPVVANLAMRYEKLHIAVLILAALGMTLVGSLGPYMWVAFAVTALSLRALYYCVQSISTNDAGISMKSPLGASQTLPWDQIKTVRYWFSLTQGGVELSDGVHRICVYRWIGNYPRFVALLHHKVPADRFPTVTSIPFRVQLNERRKTSWLVFGIIAGTAPWLAFEGYGVMAAMTAISTLLTGFVFSVGSSRTIFVEQNEIRDVQRVALTRTTTVYPLRELSDMRMGRQLTAGGLWLKFGNRRLEIGNLESKMAPEEIFRILKQEWHWRGQVQAQVQAEPSRDLTTRGN